MIEDDICIPIHPMLHPWHQHHESCDCFMDIDLVNHQYQNARLFYLIYLLMSSLVMTLWRKIRVQVNFCGKKSPLNLCGLVTFFICSPWLTCYLATITGKSIKFSSSDKHFIATEVKKLFVERIIETSIWQIQVLLITNEWHKNSNWLLWNWNVSCC